jgi:hypothetical protein
MNGLTGWAAPIAGGAATRLSEAGGTLHENDT